MNTRFFALIVVVSLGIYACKEKPKEEVKETVTALPQGQLQADLALYQDSIAFVWKNMIYADDQKIAFTKRLLDEISYMPKYNIVTHAKLIEMCKTLKDKRFSEAGILNSDSIDKYDAATDTLLKAVKALVVNTPNVENYPLCNELLKDINSLDNDVIMHRVMYDTWAQRYNQLLDEQKDALASLGTPYSDLKKKGTFQLQ